MSFDNESHVEFIKHPTTTFKDSISLVNYVRDLQTSAINKGYLLASIDNLSFHNQIATLNFYLGERFEDAQITMDQDEMNFVRKHSRLNERFISQLAFTPKVLAAALKDIQAAYLNNGYPFVRLQFEEVVISGAKMTA
ncbi:MAG: hypothetical protein HWE22_13440, partial [Flavobacteriales bacterium]|nr:hypothetical protein [Flavobacteriales bacterium]